jgi:hypothetical protein
MTMRTFTLDWQARMSRWQFSAAPETVKKPRKPKTRRAHYAFQEREKGDYLRDMAHRTNGEINPAHPPRKTPFL